MKQKTKQTLIASMFIVVFLCCVLLINQFYIQQVDVSSRAYLKESEWQAYKEQLPTKHLEYAFFGDSMTERAVHTPQMNNSFNFAVRGEDYAESYYRYQKVNQEVNISTVILQLNLHTFSLDYRNGLARLHAVKKSNILTFSNIQEYARQTTLMTLLRIQFPSFGAGREMIRYKLVELPLTQEQGWYNTTANYSDFIGKETDRFLRLEMFFPQQTYTHDHILESFMLQLVKDAHAHNQTIIFLIAPVEKNFLAKAKEYNITKEQIIQPIFSLVNNITTNYTVLDYEELFFDHEDYFADPVHVNYHGALALTSQLKEDLEALKGPSNEI